MPSTYTVNLGIEKPATGEQSGTWGDTTNVNFDILDQAVNGAVRVTLTSAGSSGSPNALQITNGATSDGRNKWVEFYSSGDLGGSAYVQLDPNDAEKIVFVRNSLASSRSVILFQGTYNSARDLEVPAGVDMVVKFDGGGASAATVTDVYTKLRVTELTTPTLTATTADINGGTLDNSVIGGTTAAAITGTTIVANTSLNIAGDGATVTGIKDEDNMASNSATKLATQQSIKAYVDSQVGTVDTLAEILANGNTSGSNNLIINNGQALTSNTINETTAGSGVTIDSVLLKDDVVNATDVETSSISANDGTAAATIADSTGNFTITNFISNSVDIGGGAIDGTVIGGSSAAAGSFTTGSFSGAVSALNYAIPSISNIFSSSFNLYIQTETDGTGIVLNSRTGFLTFQNDGTNVAQIGTSAVVFNEQGGDIDFRVESNGNANMLFVDAGNNRVGVGTGSPANELHIDGSSDTTVRITTSSTSVEPKLVFVDGSGDYGSFEKVDRNLKIKAFNTDVAYFTQDGDVGIGTDSPAVRLHLKDSSAAQLRLYRTNSTEGVGVGMEFAQNNDASEETVLAQMFGVLVDNTDGTEDGKIAFHINQNGSVTEKFSIDSAGAFVSDGGAVINEDSQDSDFRVESDGNANMLFVDASTDRVGVGVSDPQAELFVRKDTAGPARIAISNSGTVGSTTSSRLAFYEGNTETSYIERRRDGSGDTAIVTPAADNPVNIEVNGGNELASFTGSSIIFNQNGADQDFRVESDSNTHALFLDAGNDKVALYTSDVTGQLWGDTNTKFVVNGLSYFGDNASDMGSVPIDNVSAIASSRGVTHRGSGSTPTGTLALVRDGTSAVSYGGWAALDLSQFETSSVASRTALHFRVGYGNLDTYDYDTVPEVATFRGDLAVFNDQSKDIDFRVESNNNSHMLFVDAQNDFVGINKGSPEAVLHVKSTSAGAMTTFESSSANSSGGPNIRLWRNSASPADGDGLARLVFQGMNSAAERIDYAEIQTEIIDASDGTEDGLFQIETVVDGVSRNRLRLTGTESIFNDGGRDIDFRVESDASTHALFLNAGTGSITAGTATSLGGRIEADRLGFSDTGNDNWKKGAFVGKGSFGGAISLVNDGGASDGFAFFLTGTPSVLNLRFGANGGTMSAGVQLSSTATAWAAYSDSRLKTITSEISGAVSSVNSLRAVNYTLNSDDADTPRVGLIAQEVQAVLPEAVDVIDEDGHLGLRYTEVIPLLVAAIKEQQTTIETLEARITALENT